MSYITERLTSLIEQSRRIDMKNEIIGDMQKELYHDKNINQPEVWRKEHIADLNQREEQVKKLQFQLDMEIKELAGSISITNYKKEEQQ